MEKEKKGLPLHWLMFVVMIALIGASIFALVNASEASSGKARDNAPTAYIEGTQVNAGFKMPGRITEMLVSEGDIVKKGDVLARLESKEIEEKVRQAEAALATAQAKYSQGNTAVSVTSATVDKQIAQAEAVVKAAEAKLEALRNGVREEELAQAKAQLEATEEVYAVAEDTLKRIEALYEEGLVAKNQLDEVQVKFQEAKGKYEVAQQTYEMALKGARVEEIKAAEAQVEQARAALAMAIASQGQVDIRQGDVQVAAAAIAQAQAAVDEARTYLSYTELIAPVDGVIVTKSGELGELVGSGFPVYTIETPDTRWVKFYFHETDITQLEVGQQATVRLIATDEELKGEITSIAPVADYAIRKATQSAGETDIRSFHVKVEFPDLPDRIKTGMTVQWVYAGESK